MQERAGALQQDWIRRIAEAFIGTHYAREQVIFPRVWDVFREMAACGGGEFDSDVLKSWVEHREAGLGMADGRVDWVTPIVMATVAGTLRAALDEEAANQARKRPSPVDYRMLVSKVAPGYGATGELLARLVEHVPKLCSAALSARAGMREADIPEANAQPLQFQVWIKGKHQILSSIESYNTKRDRYMFWVDKDGFEKSLCLGKPGLLQRQSVQLLVYLVERLGKKAEYRDILASVWSETVSAASDVNASQRNKVAVQVAKLNAFSNEEFAKHLDHYESGLLLRESFSSEYFIFQRAN